LLTAVAACTALGTRGDIEGTWLYESYTDSGESVEVVVDVNAANEPFVIIEDCQMKGNVGCNGFGGDFAYAEGELRAGEIFSEAALCMPETLMGQSGRSTK
jgi:heat shock protein HslJ